MANITYEGEYKDASKWCWIALRILANVKQSPVKFVGIYRVKRWELKEAEGPYNDRSPASPDHLIWSSPLLWSE